MRVDQAQIERAHIWSAVGDSNENGTIKSRVTLVRFQVGLGSISSNGIGGTVGRIGGICGFSGVGAGIVGAGDNMQRGVGNVQLRHPKDILCTASFCLRCGDVAVVGADFLPRKIPLQQYHTTRGRERYWANLANRGTAAIS